MMQNLIEKNNTLAYLCNHLDLELLDNGYAELGTAWNERDVRSPYSRLYYILSGEGILDDGEREYRMTPGNLYFVPTGTLFTYRCEERLEKVYFHIHVRRADRYDLFAGCRGVFQIPSRESADRSIVELFHRTDCIGAAAISALLFRDLTALLSAMPEPPVFAAVGSPLVRSAISYIRRNLSNRLRTGEIASALFVSPSCLSAHFRREIGVPIGRYIDDMVSFRAQEYLLRDDLSIGEISLRLGFCDQFYFARKFKQLHGESPNSFRRRQRNLY